MSWECRVMGVSDTPLSKEHCLSYVDDFYCFDVPKGQTYREFLNILKEKFMDNAAKLKAVREFVEFNMNNPEVDEVVSSCTDIYIGIAFMRKKVVGGDVTVNEHEIQGTCTLKDCRLRVGKEISEQERDYREDYPFNMYGYSCDVAQCKIRQRRKV